ncbi:hypothetical protein [Gordonia alkaliphila]|uniref:hypothetical protein n=1 Tax=Gordonia alkaliphila TaxID=1053547 RepID=UPI0031EAA594
MSESNLPPEQWRPLFDGASIEFGYRPLATRAGLTHTRVHRLLRGGGTTDEAIQLVADAFGVKSSKVRELRGEPAVEVEPFTLPDDAGRLTHDERNVVRAVVRALLDARDRHAAQPTTPADPPAEAPRTPCTDDESEKTEPSAIDQIAQAGPEIYRRAKGARPKEGVDKS